MPESKRKILILINQLNVGGTEKQLLKQMQALQKSFEIRILLVSGSGDLIEEFKKLDLELHQPITFAGKNIARLHFIVNMLQSLKWFKPDIIHFYLPEAYIIGGILSVLFAPNKKLMMSRRSLNIYSQNHKILSLIERFLHKRMTKILSNSNAISQDLMHEGVEEKKIIRIYNGVKNVNFSSLSEKQNTRKRYNVSHESVLIIVASNLYHYKGLDDLIEAIAHLEKEFQNFKVLIFGNDYGYKPRLVRLISKYNLKKYVSLIEGEAKLSLAWNAADIGVLPSHQEGFSNSLLEGMSSGTAMIVTNVGGNPEAIEHNVEGILVNPKKPFEIFEALFSLVKNKRRRDEMGLSGRKKAKKLFDQEKMIREMRKIYRNI